ncbi:IclR family transcriptional regulator [Halosolutus gelatinilyticus]|uniref:IclR family transcriptional regulator n=1 Tax=Halosolutus gelatinilyticus TaxID=2931975 RepID=UPI001FF24D01|nr:IclR family transcriptional regulator [Halosolutus gelatinilyticus]
MRTDDTGDGRTIKSLERGFEIIETLAELEGARLTEVSTAIGLSVSTTHTYLQTLVETGYVRRAGDQYELNLRFLQQGGRVRQSVDVYDVARPEVDRLARETNEVASLGIEEDGQRVLIYKSEGDNAIYDNAPTGEYTNMHWSALGKALLSRHSRSELEAIVDEYGLEAQTDRTITDVETLRSELERIRERGYSIENEERRAGIRSVGVPIVTDDDDVIGALSISGPKNRINDAWIEETAVPLLRNAANIVEVKYVHN